MKLKALSVGAALVALLALPSAALAAWGQVTGNVNLRSGPGTGYHRILTLPAGARVWVGGTLNGWYHVRFNGTEGYVSSSYVATAVMMPPRFVRPAPPRSGFWKKPWWDDRYHAWYDGRRWYRNGIWYNSPQGFSFGFTFGN
jgi:uncharacterized protein YraI